MLEKTWFCDWKAMRKVLRVAGDGVCWRSNLCKDGHDPFARYKKHLRVY